jgi:hypothetical protein
MIGAKSLNLECGWKEAAKAAKVDDSEGCAAEFCGKAAQWRLAAKRMLVLVKRRLAPESLVVASKSRGRFSTNLKRKLE